MNSDCSSGERIALAWARRSTGNRVAEQNAEGKQNSKKSRNDRGKITYD
jgi:hypothetical protein